MKKFAVLIRKENNKDENEYYFKAIEKFGGVVVFIKDDEKVEDVLFKLNDVEGILLTGGDEVGRLDFVLIDYALKNNLKLFGICQGMQSMALYNTDLELIEIGNDSHFKKGNYIHKVILDASKIKEILEKNIIDVNSHHHKTVIDSKEFKIVGKSEDGLIEVVENPNHKFQIGVQWHPERMLQYDSSMNLLFEKFITL